MKPRVAPEIKVDSEIVSTPYALHEAVIAGNTPLITKLLARPATKIDAIDNHGLTPFLLAVKHQKKEIAELLLKSGASINKKFKGNSALHFAVCNADSAMSAFLLENKANPNEQSTEDLACLIKAKIFRQTPIDYARKAETPDVTAQALFKANPNNKSKKNLPILFLATLLGHVEIINQLIKAGANIRATVENLESDEKGSESVINFAIQYYQQHATETLLFHGAQLTTPPWLLRRTNQYGFTLLHIAAQKNHLAVVKKLIKELQFNNIPINSTDDTPSPLHLASEQGHLFVVEELIKAKASLEASDAKKHTALHYAADQGQLSSLDSLLSHGAKIDAESTDNMTPFLYAVKNNHFATVNKLILEIANVNKVNINGDTALHFAAVNGNLEMIKLLLACKVDGALANKKGYTALAKAVEYGHLDEVKFLLGKFHKDNLVLIATKTGQDNVFQELLARGANTSATNKNQSTVLHLAAYYNHSSIIKTILTRDTKLLNVKNKSGQTPLHSAAKNGSLHAVTTLLNEKKLLAIDAVDNENQSPLFLACAKGHTAIIETLLSHGANLNTHPNPLLIALKQGHENIVKILLKNGANANTIDEEKKSALDYGIAHDHPQITKLLITEHKAECSESPLYNAVSRQSIAVVHELLLIPHIEITQDILAMALKTNLELAALLLEHSKQQIDFKKYPLLLHIAIKQDYKGLANIIINSGAADLELEDSHSLNALELAAKHGQLDILKKLSQDKRMTQDHVSCAFLLAVSWNQLTTVQWLLNSDKIDIYATDERGHNALHIATRERSPLLVVMLLAKQPRLAFQKTEDSHLMPLHIATKMDFPELIPLLNIPECDLDERDDFGRTPMHIASIKNHLDVMTQLQQLDVNLDARDANLATPLHYAAEHGNTMAVEFLIAWKAQTQLPLIDGSTPLHLAAAKGHTDIIKIFLRAQENNHVINDNGLTPLHFALQNGNLDSALVLLNTLKNSTEIKLDENTINTQDKMGNTLLHKVVVQGQLDNIKKLLAFRANPTIANANAITPIDIAIKQGDYKASMILHTWKRQNSRKSYDLSRLFKQAIAEDDTKIENLPGMIPSL